MSLQVYPLDSPSLSSSRTRSLSGKKRWPQPTRAIIAKHVKMVCWNLARFAVAAVTRRALLRPSSMNVEYLAGLPRKADLDGPIDRCRNSVRLSLGRPGDTWTDFCSTRSISPSPYTGMPECMMLWEHSDHRLLAVNTMSDRQINQRLDLIICQHPPW